MNKLSNIISWILIYIIHHCIKIEYKIEMLLERIIFLLCDTCEIKKVIEKIKKITDKSAMSKTHVFFRLFV